MNPLDLFVTAAHAQAAPAASPGGAGIFDFALPLIFFVAIYFILLRPQMRRQKEHKTMVAALAKGDEIVTNGGIAGKILEIGDTFLTVEIAKGTEVKVQRQAVGMVLPKGTLKSA
ncbi:MAG: preprotein translocase subunit YajC [Gammaproteobacteria bacterium]|nr:preprotein translocase subunit YajC [Gammaproteobacteria bacterium]MCG3142760.1 Sec translocon accessory complex subunit YajC [Gammaproteobacteria bacterium]